MHSTKYKGSTQFANSRALVVYTSNYVVMVIWYAPAKVFHNDSDISVTVQQLSSVNGKRWLYSHQKGIVKNFG